MKKRIYTIPLIEVAILSTAEMMTVAGESQIQNIPEPGFAPASKRTPVF